MICKTGLSFDEYFYNFSNKLSAWKHHEITWTNIDLLSMVFNSTNLEAILKIGLMNLICNMCAEISLLKELLPHLPGATELNNNL